MKTLFLFFTFAFLASAALGQTEAGMKSLSGGLSISSSGGTQRYVQGYLSPSGLFFIADNLGVGGSIQLAYSSYSSFWSLVTGIGPFAKYYLGSFPLKPFIEAGASYSYYYYKAKSADVYFGSSDYRSFISVFGGAGIEYFFDKQIGITGTFLYETYKYTDNPRVGQVSFAAGIDVLIP